MKRQLLGLVMLVSSGFLILQMSACTIGYTKLTMHKIRNDTTWVLYQNLPKDVADTVTKIFEQYHKENMGINVPVYKFPELVSLDSTVVAEIIKYQDFYSKKLRFPFGYFFRFGRKKYFIPYGEQRINPPFVYYDFRFYFLGKYMGTWERPPHVEHPDHYKVEVKNRYYVVYKMKGKRP